MTEEPSRATSASALERGSCSKPYGIVIPARLASTRLPNKPLRELAGRPLLAHVCENALRARAEFVLVATDDLKVAEIAELSGVQAVLTSPNHPSGTDRLAEVVEKMGIADSTIVVNVQGDEPFLPPNRIEQVAGELARQEGASLATLATPITTVAEWFDPNAVKVVIDRSGRALYFSRAPIPWPRDAGTDQARAETLAGEPCVLRHIGLYAYRAGAIRQLAGCRPCRIEGMESLEQLRALWLGLPIFVVVAEQAPPPGIDTEEDLARAEAFLQGNSRPEP